MFTNSKAYRNGGAFTESIGDLLNGRRATTHWAFVDLLLLVGATHEKARVVTDGNVITAAGVSSGIDLAFIVAGSHEVGARVCKVVERCGTVAPRCMTER